MKYAKMLGLALVAAAALMAFVGAGTASATKLCKNNLNTTTCSESYGTGTVIDATLAGEKPSAILETTGGTVLDTCTSSTVKGKTATAGSSTETVKGPIEELTWGGCTKETKTLTTGELEIHHIAGTDNGTLTAKDTQVTVNGLFENESCVYGAGTGTDLGVVTGGATATITINALVKRVTGGFSCPAETRWTASYTVTAPKPLYVSVG
ncbi:MAG TPA: hypothetical protein VGW80_10015 [Solirubrobacterales bacterium]|jgi:hypothetical protein|nr:hypothetical protein [Solirubrobacterales bacterium]